MDEMQLIHKLIDIFRFKENYQLITSKLQQQDMYVLERIYFKERIRVMDIAREYNIAPSTLTGIIDRLENKNLIQRIRNESDRRSVEIIVSENGKLIVDKHIEEDILFTKNFFDALEKEKKEHFKKLLEELVYNIDNKSLFEEGE